MDHNKVTDYLALMKLLIDSQVALLNYQTKVEALFEMVLQKDLIDYPSLKLHVYLRALGDSVGSAISFTDDIMEALSIITTLLRGTERPILV